MAHKAPVSTLTPLTQMDRDLTLAILALDAYNEGYKPGMLLPSGSGSRRQRETVSLGMTTRLMRS